MLMINPIFNKWNKAIITVTMTALCIIFSACSYCIDSFYGIYLTWSLIFVIPLYMVWETRYTAISATAVCTVLPFIQQYYNRFYQVEAAHYLGMWVWFLTINIFNQTAMQKKLKVNIYIVHVFASMLIAMLYFFASVNGFLIAAEANIIRFPSYIKISCINDILVCTMMLVLSEVFIELPTVRRFLGFSPYPCSSKSTVYGICAIVGAIIFIICDSVIDTIYFDSYGLRVSFIKLTNGIGIKLPIVITVIAVFCKYLMVSTRRMQENYEKTSTNENRLCSILSNMSDVYFEVDRFGIISDVSLSVEKVFGIKMIDVIGRNISALFDDDSTVKELIGISEYKGEITNVETSIIIDNKKHYMLIDANTIKDDEQQEKVYIFARDITEIRHDEHKIRDLNKQLESMIVERTNQLSEAYSDLESFSYTVSHELKTPIREIETYIEFIEEDNRDVLEEQSVNDIASVKKICENTIKMIQSMMEYSKIGYKALNNENVNMNEIVLKSFEDIMMPLNDRKVELILDNLPYMYGDKFLIQQMVFNIISNSVKFTREKDDAKINISGSENDYYITYKFVDNGVGFEHHSSSQVLGIFDRMHDESEYEGSGIGLATVNKIVQRFNGSISIESRVNEGCAVSLIFPKHSNSKK